MVRPPGIKFYSVFYRILQRKRSVLSPFLILCFYIFKFRGGVSEKVLCLMRVYTSLTARIYCVLTFSFLFWRIIRNFIKNIYSWKGSSRVQCNMWRSTHSADYVLISYAYKHVTTVYTCTYGNTIFQNM